MPIELKDIARMRSVWNFLREQAQAQQPVLLPIQDEEEEMSNVRTVRWNCIRGDGA